MFKFPWHYFILDRFMDPNLNEDLGIGPQLFLNSQISIGPTIPTKPNKKIGVRDKRTAQFFCVVRLSRTPI
jgi:hypothetical protein